MSCFIVPDFHVSALVAWAIRADVLPDAVSPDALAHELASANRAAFAERYAGGYSTDWDAYTGLDRSAGAELLPVAIVKACNCLEYQASEWTCWENSSACGYLDAIRSAALALADPAGRVSTSGRALPGYDAAPWCLDEPEPEPAADRLAATLASMTEHEAVAIRSALAATRCAA